MRSSLLPAMALAALLPAVAPASAQRNPNPGMDNPTVVEPKSAPSDKAPEPGANSFAEGQARDLLKSQGYSDVSPLVNDSQGIWRGTANKGASKVHVSVDYKGQVTATP